ncbi:MAG TPA: ribosome biogenesis GTP-binding protein YihA/YsxC [Burkholderiales bacterium]|nr:ribosome biogenesis GTP-binding protein YihA/YsxC [Burkholderiales bacterium]
MSALSQAVFTMSVARLEQLPPEGPPELAIVGRSNVGKSSAINALAGRRRLAFVSKTPGRTQTLNFFDLGAMGRLVDLPGYGYARVPQAVRAQWDRLVGGYLQGRASLAAVVVILDARRSLTPQDAQVIRWLAPLGRPLLILLSKCDKLSRAARQTALQGMREALSATAARVELRLFSSLTGEGVEEARSLLEAWLRAAQPDPGNKRPPAKGM